MTAPGPFSSREDSVRIDGRAPRARLGVGVVGCGLIGRRRAEVVRRVDDCDLVVVADTEECRAVSLAGEMGCLATTAWEAVVARDDVDIVVISTSNNWLAPIAVAALNSGKNILVEKPAGRTPAEVESIVFAAQQAARFEAASSGPALATRSMRPVVRVGFNHRHHPAVWKAHELLLQDAIGDVMFARCRYGHGGRPGYDKEWRADPAICGGGELLDQGIHLVDLLRWFVGEFSEAIGLTGTYFWDLGQFPPSDDAYAELAGRRGEDNGFALFRTASGQVATMHTSWTQWKNLFCFEVFGRDGYLVVDGLGGSYGPERLTWGRRRPESGPPEEERFEFPGPDTSWEAEWKDLVAAIREGREPLANARDGLQAIRIVYGLYESARTGRMVEL